MEIWKGNPKGDIKLQQELRTYHFLTIVQDNPRTLMFITFESDKYAKSNPEYFANAVCKGWKH